MTKRNKVQLFEQIRKAHATSENPSIRDLSRTFKVHRRMVREWNLSSRMRHSVVEFSEQSPVGLAC